MAAAKESKPFVWKGLVRRQCSGSAAARMNPLSKLCLLLLPVVLLEMQVLVHRAGLRALMMDTRPTWDLAACQQALEAMGAAGRSEYERFYVGLMFGGDLMFPIVYGGAFAGLLWDYGSRFWWVPLSAVFFDVQENLTVLQLVRSYPKLDADLVWWGGRVATPLKWASVLLCTVLLVNSVRSGGSAKAKAH